MLDAAAQGQCIALARSVLVEHDLATGRLVRLCDVGVPTEYAYHAIYQDAACQRAEVVSFIDWLVTSARQSRRVRDSGEQGKKAGSFAPRCL